MDDWKPYLHTSLFGSFPPGGEPFLFPSFVITGLPTYLAAAAVTFGLGIVERLVSALLSPPSPPSSSSSGPSTAPSSPPPAPPLPIKFALYFLSTLLRYLLMIISMGMDWFVLLTIVSSLSIGQLLFFDLRLQRRILRCSTSRRKGRRADDAAQHHHHVLLSSVETRDFDSDVDDDDDEPASSSKERTR